MEKSNNSLKLKSKRKKRDSSPASQESVPSSKKVKMDLSNSRSATSSLRATPKNSPAQSQSSSGNSRRTVATPKITSSTASSAATPPPKSKPAVRKKAKQRKKRGGAKDEVISDDSEDEFPIAQVAGKVPALNSTDVSSMKPRARKKRSAPFDPPLSHAGSILIYRCIESAIRQGADYRDTLDSTDWSALSGEVSLTHKDISLIWVLISKQYSGMPLKDVMAELKPAATVSAHHLSWKDTMNKLKAEKPKAPLTAYMLYCQSMRPKFKEKYPDFTHGQLAVKIGKKWKSLSVDKQQKYRQEYQSKYAEYRDKMEQFLDKHPEARSARMKSRSSVYNMETKRVTKLKEMKPKCPPTAVNMYVKAKEASLSKKQPSLSQRDVKARLTRQWKTLSMLERAPYRKQYIDMNVQYEQELVQFFTDNPDAERLLMSTNKSSKKRPPEDLSESTSGLTSSVEAASQRQDGDSSDSSSSSSEEGSGEEEEGEEVLSGPSNCQNGSSSATPTPANPSRGLRQDKSSATPTPANPSRALRQDKSSATPTPANPSRGLRQDKVSAAPSLLVKQAVKQVPSSSSTPYPTKHSDNSAHHIPIIDSEDLSSSESDDSSEY